MSKPRELPKVSFIFKGVCLVSAKWGFVGRNLYEGVNSVAKMPKSDGHGNDNGVGPPPEQGNSHLFRPMKKIVGTWKTAENNRNFEMKGRRTVFDSDVPFEMEKKKTDNTPQNCDRELRN